MGGSLNPQTDDPELRRARGTSSISGSIGGGTSCCAALAAHRCDDGGVSIKAPSRRRCWTRSASHSNRGAVYAAWSQDRYYLWDELAACAWLDPSIITKEGRLYGRRCEATVLATANAHLGGTQCGQRRMCRRSHAQLDVDLGKFTREFVELMSAPTQEKRTKAGN